MNVKKHIEEMKEELLSMKEGGVVTIAFDEIYVTLGNNGIYYIVLNDGDTMCFSNCESEKECICSRKFPNSFSFLTVDEVANFMVLNLFDGQVVYQ
jgi:hypothetical protein